MRLTYGVEDQVDQVLCALSQHPQKSSYDNAVLL
jgi:hypothetical protein